MDTSGLILDMYDDFKGDVLRSIYPTPGGIPDFVKQAQMLSSEDQARLPDDAFALVLINGEHTLRKFACVDEGGTALSVQYFLKNAHKLPVEAQKVAAENLATACSWYDLAVPPQLSKIADVLGTSTMPYQATTGPRTPDKTTINKTAKNNAGRGVVEEAVKGTMPAALPQARQLKPHVEVTTKTASVTRSVALEASSYALPEQRKYPLDSYVQVKTASHYFNDFYKDFAPEDRHTYAINLVKRANALGLSVSETARRYGSESYASDEDMKIAFQVREKACAWGDDARSMFHELFEKRAELEPEVFARALTQLDKSAGLNHEYDRNVPDPYFSTFNDPKLAEEKDFSEIIGNEYVTGGQLMRLAKEPYVISQHFDDDFAKEFRKDPISIFKSLPVEQRKIVARMAAEAAE